MSNQIVRIEIVSGAVETRKGTSKKTGEPYEMRQQEAYLHNGHAYPDRFPLDVPKDSDRQFLQPYAPGFYTLAPGSIGVGDYGLEINKFEMRLLRLPEEEQGKYAAKAK